MENLSEKEQEIIDTYRSLPEKLRILIEVSIKSAKEMANAPKVSAEIIDIAQFKKD